MKFEIRYLYFGKDFFKILFFSILNFFKFKFLEFLFLGFSHVVFFKIISEYKQEKHKVNGSIKSKIITLEEIIQDFAKEDPTRLNYFTLKLLFSMSVRKAIFYNDNDHSLLNNSLVKTRGKNIFKDPSMYLSLISAKTSNFLSMSAIVVGIVITFF